MINVFEIAWLTEEQISRFRSDFRIVADYFRQKQATGTYTGTRDEIRHVHELLQLLSVMENDERYEGTYVTKTAEGGIRNMCDVIDRLEEKKEAEVRESVAMDMLRDGDSLSKIARISRLSEAKIHDIAKKLNIAVL